jgi:hypothetical protein
LAPPIKGRMGSESILDFDPEVNNLKKHVKGMDRCCKPLYHRLILIV